MRVAEEGQRLNKETADLALEIKADTDNTLSGFKSRVEAIDKFRREFQRLRENVTTELMRAHDKVTATKKETHLKCAELDKKCANLEGYVESTVDIVKVDMDAIRKHHAKFSSEFSNFQFYVDRLLPIKVFSQNCSLFHNVLRGTDEYNSFVKFEHQEILTMREKLAITEQKYADKDLERMRVVFPVHPCNEASRKFVSEQLYSKCMPPLSVEAAEEVKKEEK